MVGVGSVAGVNDASWGAVGVGIFLIAVVVGIGGYVWYGQSEAVRLGTDVDLARTLRTVVGGDLVRVAAIEEFESAIFERLFYVSTVGPRARGAAWALLGTVLAAFGALWVPRRSRRRQ